jgi:hypothetical protein
VHSNEWVDTLNVFRAAFGIIAVEVGMCASVNSLLAIKETTESGAEFFICAVTGGLVIELVRVAPKKLSLTSPKECRHRHLGPDRYVGG